MKSVALAIFLLCPFVAARSGHAADSFTGAYIGASVGYGGGQSHASGTAELSSKPTGALGGVQGGYNWRSRDVIYGLGMDIDAARMDTSVRCPNSVFDCKTEVRSVRSLRGNVGRLAGNYLVYGTVGLSSTRIKVSVDDHMGSSNSQNTTHTGWVAGLGLARRIGDRLWWQAQFLHADLGKKDYTLQGISFRNKVTTDAVVVGVNYSF